MKQQQTLADFPFPESLTAERQVLADVASNPDTLPDVMEIVTPDLFSTDETRKIWETMVSMFNAGEKIDVFSLRTKCGREFSTNTMAGVSEIGTPFTTIQHAKMLRDEAARCRAYNAACWLLEKCTKPGATEDDMVEAASKIADRFQQRSSKGETSMADVVSMIADDVENRIELARQGKSASIPTGISRLDAALCGGFEPGQLIILAARPSVGKTALMLQLARVAAEHGAPAMIFSLEMTEVQLGRRMMLSTNLLTREELATGVNIDWDKFNQASEIVASWPITINARSRQTSEIVSKMTTACLQGKCRIAFGDYLGLFKGGGTLKEMTNAQRIGEITKELKATALRCGIPIVLLCQLNREKDKGAGREPQLTDLRDSGDIEQDADVVLMLDQEQRPVADEMGGAEERDILKLWVRKLREGARNFCIDLLPNETYTRFIEIDKDEF